MACVPCQVILWDKQAIAMIEGASTLVSMKMQGVTMIPIPDGWPKEWYEMIESHCRTMQTMLDKITGVHDATNRNSG